VVKTIYLVLFAVLIGVGVTSAYAINITLGGTVLVTETLDMMGNNISNLGGPEEPTDAATKAYVDSLAYSGNEETLQIRLQTDNLLRSGTISCPDENILPSTSSSIEFTEHDGIEKSGVFAISSSSGWAFYADLWGGQIQNDEFSFTGVGYADTNVANFCVENASERFEVRVWGTCGQESTVQFDSDFGYSGSFTGNILCV